MSGVLTCALPIFFTPIGKIEGVTQKELLAALGNGSVSVTFSLD